MRIGLVRVLPVVAALLLAAQPAPAQESNAAFVKDFGTMWTFDAPPLDYWKTTYNFTPPAGWLDHVRLASVRLPGCSASFVSGQGLVMTNHHCARSCIAAGSPADTNYMETGFVSTSIQDERKCPGMYVDQLQSITDVTAKVQAAVTATSPGKQAEQRSAVIGTLEGLQVLNLNGIPLCIKKVAKILHIRIDIGDPRQRGRHLLLLFEGEDCVVAILAFADDPAGTGLCDMLWRLQQAHPQ